MDLGISAFVDFKFADYHHHRRVHVAPAISTPLSIILQKWTLSTKMDNRHYPLTLSTIAPVETLPVVKHPTVDRGRHDGEWKGLVKVEHAAQPLVIFLRVKPVETLPVVKHPTVDRGRHDGEWKGLAKVERAAQPLVIFLRVKARTLWMNECDWICHISLQFAILELISKKIV
ncbi:hypothetical protein DEO72_LG1g2164 [Vigna unguiculata]|uniref:Uncharacterized protein n=1 Tax=Vigna unguiculata TaxID=3917 RepID=A0A4D6KLT7_VIGUN|nr:hypothetical protein DEO72_LG1g2164 [Vigna unguiculata]